MSLDIFSMATDREAETKGVEFNWNGATLLVARANNANYLRFVQKEYQKFRAIIEGPDTKKADAQAEELSKQAFIRHILVGWKGMESEGKSFPHNLKNAAAVYDAVPDLVRDVTLFASEGENYRIATLNKDAESLKK